jgi:prophage maintenance system killer protein
MSWHGLMTPRLLGSLSSISSMHPGISSSTNTSAATCQHQSVTSRPCGAIKQTFGGQDLYPSTQEKAANLLNFVVKDHPFLDGNKRNAAALFTNYLTANGALRRAAPRHSSCNA